MKRKKILSYLKNKNKHPSEYDFGFFQVFVQNPLPDSIDVKAIFSHIKQIIPDHFLDSLDVVYIGDYSFLKEREINALYSDGAIYISNAQEDGEDLEDDIVHELSHAVEEKYGEFFYSDGKIVDEFLLKRSKLKRLLTHQGYDIARFDFSNPEYDEEFDEFLYSEVGYDSLRLLTIDIFTGAYAATSLREYFARGFEEYYLGDKVYLKQVSPYIYKKLSLLNEKDLEELDYDDRL